MFWLKVVRISGLPAGPKLFCGVAFVKGVGALRKGPIAVAPRRLSARFPRKTNGAAEFTPQYLSTALAPKGRGRATPPHRQNYLSAALLGKGLRVQTRDYTYAPRLCQARAAPSPPAVKISAPRARFLLKSVPGKATKRRTRKGENFRCASTQTSTSPSTKESRNST